MTTTEAALRFFSDRKALRRTTMASWPVADLTTQLVMERLDVSRATAKRDIAAVKRYRAQGLGVDGLPHGAKRIYADEPPPGHPERGLR